MTGVASTDGLETSPRLLARITGVVYLVVILVGMFAELTREKLIVSGDAAATVHNILASETLYRGTLAADLLGGACYVVVTLLLYVLLKPVNKSVSLLAAFFSLVGIAVGSASVLALLGTLSILGGAHYLAAFEASQLQALAYLGVRVHGQGYIISLFFFGFYCLLLGYLIFRSTFLPRTVGILLVLAGLCYLINSFSALVSPPLANVLSNFILYPGLVGEGGLTLWLIVFGVNAQKWEDQANRSTRPLNARAEPA
jgi:hypothetical protein